jgi:hypothetical protein
VHIYFVNPVTVGPGPTTYSGYVVYIHSVRNVVIDGMGNLKIYAPGQLAGIIVGNEGYNPDILDNVVNLVIKNFEIDGGYYAVSNNGVKWGLSGAGTTNFGICNAYIHNTEEEHGIYHHLVAGNFEVVKSRFDVTGRTCIQVRHSGTGSKTAKYIIADNVCTNSCDAGILTLDDTSGTWWTHGNYLSKFVSGLTVYDSSNKDPDPLKANATANHTDGRVYIYDNKIHFGDFPKQSSEWGSPYCAGMSKPVVLNQGGSRIYFKNNVVLVTGGNNQSPFDVEQDAKSTYYCPTQPGWANVCPVPPGGIYPGSPGGEETFPVKLEQSDNNIWGLGHPLQAQNETANFAKWGYESLTDSAYLNVAQWKTSMPSIHKPIAYDLNSQFVYGYANVLALANDCFDGNGCSGGPPPPGPPPPPITPPPPVPPPPPQGNGAAEVFRVGADLSQSSAPPNTQVAVGSFPVTALNPALFPSIPQGTYTTLVTDVAGFSESAGLCTYQTGQAACSVTQFLPLPGCDGVSCGGPLPIATNTVTKVVVKYTPLTGPPPPPPATGSVQIKRVGNDLTTSSAPSGTQAWLSFAAATFDNPALFQGVAVGSHVAYMTDIPGMSESFGTCSFTTGSSECAVVDFSGVPSCIGTSCSVSVIASSNTTTKVAVKYAASTATPPPPPNPPPPPAGPSNSAPPPPSNTGGSPAPSVTSLCSNGIPSANVSWTPSSQQGTVYVEADNDGAWVNGYWFKSAPFGTASETLPGGMNAVITSGPLTITPGATYYVRIFYLSTGTYSDTAIFAGASCSGDSAPPPGAPAMPGGFSGFAQSASEVKLTWLNPSAGSQSGFKLEQGTNGVSFSEIESLPANYYYRVVKNLASGTVYYFRLRAWNGLGSSPYTPVVSLKTSGVAGGPFTKALGKGMTNPQVAILQEFLAGSKSLYPAGTVSGYFGSLTEGAVKAFQVKYGIASSGTPGTTGYGFVGPKTRAKLNELFLLKAIP